MLSFNIYKLQKWLVEILELFQMEESLDQIMLMVQRWRMYATTTITLLVVVSHSLVQPVGDGEAENRYVCVCI